MILRSRIVQKMKSSKFVSLPKEFLEHNKIEAGDEVEFILRQDKSLTLRKADSAPSQTGFFNLGTGVIQHIKGSKCVILPKSWLDSRGIEARNKVRFILRKDGSLTVQKVEEGVVTEAVKEGEVA